MATAKLFKKGRSQAVRLPAEFRFAGTEVEIERDAKTGNVILFQPPAPKQSGTEEWLAYLKEIGYDPLNRPPSPPVSAEDQMRIQKHWEKFFELAQQVQKECPIDDDFPYRSNQLSDDTDPFADDDLS